MRKKLDPTIRDELSRFAYRRVVRNVDGNQRGLASYYHEGFLELAYKFCLLGASVPQLAKLFDVSDDTIWHWLRTREDFRDAVQSGRDLADANVARALYRRATGYSHPDVKFFYDPQRGEIVEVNFTKHYPPDPYAARTWLAARQPDTWANRRPVDPTPEPQTLTAPTLIINPVAPAQMDAHAG